MMLRPRDDDDQRVLEAELEVTPAPSEISWTRDSFGNHVAIAHFVERSSELRVESKIRVDHAPGVFRAADIEDFAQTFPFAYAKEDEHSLACFRTPQFPHPKLNRWSAQFLRKDGSADTCELLLNMTQTIRRTFKHAARHEKGIQDPIRTLELASGSCRDLAVLMITALRSLGIAARFVSGYLHLGDDDDHADVAGGNTHAWVQVYLPGSGWVDFDPSSGMFGNGNLVRVAVVHEPREALPLHGTWFGTATDHLAMEVAVRVTAAANAGSRHSPVWARQDAPVSND
jgi:transglutaminase-like putative cysteine protease